MGRTTPVGMSWSMLAPCNYKKIQMFIKPLKSMGLISEIKSDVLKAIGLKMCIQKVITHIDLIFIWHAPGKKTQQCI